MITGFDHVVIAVRDLAAATQTYETLLGRSARKQDARDGVATAIIALDNVNVELMAPEGDSEGARRLSAALETGEGLKSLVLATPDIEGLHHRFDRVGLEPEAIVERETFRSFRANTQRTNGVRLFFLQREEAPQPSPHNGASILSLDHVVIQAADMERAAALYGARLGLDMRLDRQVRNSRLMFFRCGDAIVEIAQVASRETDLLWGLSWRVANADETHARLAQAGLDISEVRPGMKPGTRVFTVRNNTCGVPTLIIEQGVR